jgi:hypothetical protein
MDAPERPPVTDSPWFWVMIFALMAVGALAAIGGKYGRRQATIERQFQARTRVAQQHDTGNKLAGDARTEPQDVPREFARPDDTLIPLWPLASLLILVAFFAGIMLVRGRDRPARLSITNRHELSG